MNQENFEKSIRVFLKKAGINSHQTLEEAIKEAVLNGELEGHETLEVTMTLEVKAIGLAKTVSGEIVLE